MTISEPIGNECEACLRRAGYLKKPPLTEGQRRYKLIMNTVRHLEDVIGLTPSQIADVFKQAEKLRHELEAKKH